MPYHVVDVASLVSPGAGDGEASAEIGQHLQNAEEDGYVLVGVVPDFQTWDEDGKPTGKYGARLILHKPAKTEGRLLA